METKTEKWYNSRTQKVIAAAIEVHKELGPGLLESVYESCLESELLSRGLQVTRQMELPLIYKGEYMGESFRLDLLIDEEIIIELKSVEHLRDIHEVQLMSYLRLANKKLGLLINFNVPVLKAGIRRKINGYI